MRPAESESRARRSHRNEKRDRSLTRKKQEVVSLVAPSAPAKNMPKRPKYSLEKMAHDWYGYGRWNAPYWFIGPEPGQEDKGRDDLEKRRAAWEGLGGGELLDCREHHLAFGFDNWHRPDAPIQSTWGKLIRLLLAYQGFSPTNEQVTDFQRTRWALSTGETCVVELSSLAAKNQHTPRDRTIFLDNRIGFLQRKVIEEKPEFVVMYGREQRVYYEKIAGAHFLEDNVCMLGTTVLIHTPHPTAFGQQNKDWDRYGEILRAHVGIFRKK